MTERTYPNCTVYKLYTLMDDYFYIGSTNVLPSVRLKRHKIRPPSKRVEEWFDRVGFENILIVPLAKYKDLTKVELRIKEDDEVRKYLKKDDKCLNCIRAYTTTEEKKEQNKHWKTVNSEHIAKQGREYRQQNRERIIEQRKEYIGKNQHRISEQRKEYRQRNKERISEQRKEYRQKNIDKIQQQFEENKATYYIKDRENKSRPYYCICCDKTIRHGEIAPHSRRLNHIKNFILY